MPHPPLSSSCLCLFALTSSLGLYQAPLERQSIQRTLLGDPVCIGRYLSSFPGVCREYHRLGRPAKQTGSALDPHVSDNPKALEGVQVTSAEIRDREYIHSSHVGVLTRLPTSRHIGQGGACKCGLDSCSCVELHEVRLRSLSF